MNEKKDRKYQESVSMKLIVDDGGLLCSNVHLLEDGSPFHWARRFVAKSFCFGVPV